MGREDGSGRQRSKVSGPRFGTKWRIGVSVGLLIVALLCALLLYPDQPGMLVLAGLAGVALVINLVVWARRRMDEPVSGGSETCSVCQKPKPRGLRALLDDESAFAAWWRQCPVCHAHYCDDHKGLLWFSDVRGTALRCLGCGHEWVVEFPRLST